MESIYSLLYFKFMKKIYLITSIIILLTLVNCQNKDKQASESEYDSDTIESNEVTNNPNSIQTDTSGVNLPDTIATKTTTITTDSSKGKFALAETKWRLVELNGKEVKNTSDKDYYINLDSKSGKFATYAGCNSFNGKYVMKSANKLAFSMISGTKMACPNMDFESKYIKALESVDNYMIEGTMLHFHKGNRSALAKFEAIK